MPLPPRHFRSGQEIGVSDLNTLGQSTVQHITVPGGQVRRAGNSLAIEIPKQRGGGATYRGVITHCPNASGIGLAHLITSGGEQQLEVTVYVERGLWCSQVGRKCLLHEAADDVAEYIASDLLPLFPGAMGTGTYDVVTSTTLAPKQLSVDPDTCES